MDQDQDIEAMTKAELVDLIVELDEKVNELAPDRRRANPEEPDELKHLKKSDLLRKVRKYQDYIARLEAAIEGAPPSDLKAYGQSGLTADQVEKLQQDKAL